MSVPIKLLACLVTVFGVTGTPYMYFSNSEKPREKKAVKLGKTEQGRVNLSLVNMHKINQFLSAGNQKLSFQDIGMKFGNQELKPDDILYSPCQNDIYYLFKAVSARLNQYVLEDGKPINSLVCSRDMSKYKHLNSVRLIWTKPSAWRLPLSSITVGSCSLYKKIDNKGADSHKLQIVCTQYKNWGDRVIGEFGEDSYEYKQ